VQKSSILTYPTYILHPTGNDHHCNFVKTFGVGKLESIGYCTMLFARSCV